jgi:hypothetical protein
VGGESLLRRRLRVDAVKDDVEVVVVGFDLRKLDRAQRVLDGERMEMKDLGEETAFLLRQRREVDPQGRAGTRREPLWVDAVEDLRPAVAVDED